MGKEHEGKKKEGWEKRRNKIKLMKERKKKDRMEIGKNQHGGQRKKGGERKK